MVFLFDLVTVHWDREQRPMDPNHFGVYPREIRGGKAEPVREGHRRHNQDDVGNLGQSRKHLRPGKTKIDIDIVISRNST